MLSCLHDAQASGVAQQADPALMVGRPVLGFRPPLFATSKIFWL